MSRADNLQTSKNPATKFYSWKNEGLTCYDKDTASNITAEMPIKLIFINEYAVIKGYDDKNNCGVYSNEVKNIGKEPLTVRSFEGGILAKGLYKNIKSKVINQSIKFHTSLYMVYDNELINIALKGASLMSWMEFKKANKDGLINNYILITDMVSLKKGRNEYTAPVFELGEKIPSDLFDMAENFDTELKKYQKEKKNAPAPEPDYTIEDEISAIDEEVGF